MLLIHCPHCEDDRPELEFRHAGEAHIARPAADIDAGEAVAASLYLRTNARGVVFERWRHIHGCGRFFNAARHSVSDAFLAFYKAGEPRPELEDVGSELGLDRLGAGSTPATVGLEGQPSPIDASTSDIPPVPAPGVGPDGTFRKGGDDADRVEGEPMTSGPNAGGTGRSNGENA